jgi:putative endonuclease
MPKKSPLPKKSSSWTVYIVRCANGSLYTGITNNLGGRIADHNAGRGAKYTAAFGPVELVWKTRKKDRSAASILEAAIKKLSRREKDSLILTKSLKKRKV